MKMAGTTSGTSINMKNIIEDNMAAKAAGLTYGKMKAGFTVDSKDTGYAVSSQSFLRPTEEKKDNKARAYIKCAVG